MDRVALTWPEVQKTKGIRYHRNHRDKLIKAGKFPTGIKGLGKQLAWWEHEIDQYLDRCSSERQTT
jgi:predicted DNA-binding transcriptional regulator AlpA